MIECHLRTLRERHDIVSTFIIYVHICHIVYMLQVYITAVGDEFNFLDFYDSSSESETPGPFSRSFQALVDPYREDEREDR